MAIKKLILGRNNDEKTFIFDKQVNILDDLSLSKELATENIKNEDSTLLIKSMSDTQIADVIQIKINLTSVGTFLVNFNKDSLNEESRKEMFEALAMLKDKQSPTLETQTEKTIKILSIVNDHKPEYVAFTNKDEIKININEISKKVRWDFPLLVLAIPPKQTSFFDKLKTYKLFQGKYIQGDYFFCLIFSLLSAFALTTSIHEFLGAQSIAVLLLILGIIFTAVLCYVYYKILIPSNDKKLKFALMVYSAIGWVIGLTGGIIVSKLFLKSSTVAFDLVKVAGIGGLCSLVLVEGTIWIVCLIKKIIGK